MTKKSRFKAPFWRLIRKSPASKVDQEKPFESPFLKAD
jgi:hypothetical protein